jgi:hypothetical protein
MNEIRSTMGTVVPIAVTILAYFVLINMPVMVPPTPIQILGSAFCSTLAVVTMIRFTRTAPIWARIVSGIVVLPLVIHVGFILWEGASRIRM